MRYVLRSLVLALAVCGIAYGAGVRTVLNAVSAASGTSGEIATQGNARLRIQACGTGFTGTLSIRQGESAANLTETKAVTLTLNSDCSTYYDLRPSSLLEVTYTRTAGSVTVILGAD